MTHVAYILLGSNLGDRYNYLNVARQKLNEQSGTITAISNIYKTEPWKMKSDLLFFNQAVKLETSLDASQLLNSLHEIERSMGRVRTTKWTSRTIDLDIGLYDDIQFNSEDLTIPHPRLHERNFALAPLSEIAGDVLHPVFGCTVSELYKHSSDHGEVVILAGS